MPDLHYRQSRRRPGTHKLDMLMLQATKGSTYAQSQRERLRRLKQITDNAERSARRRDAEAMPAPPTHEEIAADYCRNVPSGMSITYHSSAQTLRSHQTEQPKPTEQNPESNPNIGVDTLRIWTDSYTVADTDTVTGLSHHEQTDLDTGEAKEKALLNTDLFRATLFDSALVVEASLPKLTAQHNAEGTTGRENIAIAITALERRLQSRGIQTDLTQANLSRLDIACTVRLPLTVSEYDEALDLLDFPRMDVNRFNNANRTWSNTKRQICIYDKGLDLKGEPSNLARLEYRLRKADAVQRHTDCRYVGDLLMRPSALHSAYLSATRKLFDIEPGPGPKANASTTSEAFRDVLTALQDERGSADKALLAYAVSTLGASERKAIEGVIREVEGRQSLYRFRKKLKAAQHYADKFRDAEQTLTDKLRHLKDAFA